MRKKFTYIFLALLALPVLAVAQNIGNSLFNSTPDSPATENDVNAVVQKFKNAVKSNNPELVAKYIEYPFERPNPLPTIKNEKEFIQRYSSIFDKSVRDSILNSKSSDWVLVGWRGIMLDNGLLWLNNQGKLIAINSLSEEEQKYITQKSQEDRTNLYSSLRNYLNNIFVFKTARYLGRVDEIADSDSTDTEFRLVLWAANQNMSDNPDIIIKKGTVEYFGTADNHEYTFHGKKYDYVITVDHDGSAPATYTLKISKGDEPVSTEQAEIIK